MLLAPLVVGEPGSTHRLGRRRTRRPFVSLPRLAESPSTAASSAVRATRASPPLELARRSSNSSATSALSEASPRSGSSRDRRRIAAISAVVRGWSVTTFERERSAALTSNDGFSVVAADQGDRAVLDRRQQGVLLGLVEAVNLVDEEDGLQALAALESRASAIASRSLLDA